MLMESHIVQNVITESHAVLENHVIMESWLQNGFRVLSVHVSYCTHDCRFGAGGVNVHSLRLEPNYCCRDCTVDSTPLGPIRVSWGGLILGWSLY